MKVCPTCNARYDQGEEFCPSDGTELVDARELSPGKLTGTDIADGVHLDELDRADPLGERYDGTLESDDREVSVTVFNQAAEPREGRTDGLAGIVDRLGDPLPEEILAVHSFDANDADPAYVIEEPPVGRSLRTFLDDTGPFDWRPAARITAHLAQAVHWMGERGHIHRGLYPESVYLSESNWVGLQIGDWIQAELTYHPDPLEAVDDVPFVGFAPYLPPEALQPEETIDERSLVYTLGMIFYEMILGKPPFTSGGTEEILKRHLHEKPLKISIAASDQELHPELDDVFEMMWAKEPSERFQTPKAAIAALASMVGEDPHEFAPVPTADQEPVFAEAPAVEPEESGDPDAATDEEPSETKMGVAAAEPSDVDAEEEDEETDAAEAESSGDGAELVPESESDSGTVEEADEASDRDRVQSGEVEIPSLDDVEDRDRTPSSENPSIIIEDPELEEAMSTDSDAFVASTSAGAGDDSDQSPEVSSWTDALETSAAAASDKAVVMGFVDAESGMQHNPDGESVPVSVQARNLTEPTESRSGDGGSESGREAHPTPAESPGDSPKVEVNPDAEEDAPDPEAVAPTVESSDLKQDVEKAKAELRAESDAESDGSTPDLPPPSELETDSDDETSTPSEDSDAESEEPLEPEPVEELDGPAEDEDVIVLDEPSDAEDESTSEDGAPPPDLPASEENEADEAEADEPETDAVESGEIETDEVESGEVETGEVETGEVEIGEATSDEAESGDVETGGATGPPPPEESEPAARSGEADVSETDEETGTQPTETESETSPGDDEIAAPSGSSRAFTGDENRETDVTDEWFEVSDEEAWMASDVRKERDRSEVFRQYATYGFFALLLATALALTVYSLTYSPDDTQSNGEAEQSAEE